LADPRLDLLTLDLVSKGGLLV